MRLRYYLHGDQHEDGGNKWFCARCDVFVLQEHFHRDQRHMGREGDKDYPRYQKDLEGLTTYLENTEGRYSRPYSPRNCIA